MQTKLDRAILSLFGACGQALRGGGTPVVPRCDYRDGTCHELRVRPCTRCHGGYSA